MTDKENTDDIRAETEQKTRLLAAADALSDVIGGEAKCKVRGVKKTPTKPGGYELLMPMSDGLTIKTFIPSAVVDRVVDHILDWVASTDIASASVTEAHRLRPSLTTVAE